jgi:hypothetical protein
MSDLVSCCERDGLKGLVEWLDENNTSSLSDLIPICGISLDIHLYIEKDIGVSMNTYHILMSAGRYGCADVINHISRDHNHTLYLMRNIEDIIHHPLEIAVVHGQIDAVCALISFLMANRRMNNINMNELILLAITNKHHHLSILLYTTYGSDDPRVARAAMEHRHKELVLLILKSSYPYYVLEDATEWGDKDILTTIGKIEGKTSRVYV